MKRFLMVAIVGLAATLSAALAQEAEPFGGGGLSVGLTTGGSSLVVQGGATDLLGPLTLRGALDISLGGGSAGLEVAVLYPLSGDELTPYVGGGLGVGLGIAAYGLGVIGGLEYPVSDDVGLFGELQPGYLIYADYANEFSVALRLGANYYFD